MSRSRSSSPVRLEVHNFQRLVQNKRNNEAIFVLINARGNVDFDAKHYFERRAKNWRQLVDKHQLTYIQICEESVARRDYDAFIEEGGEGMLCVLYKSTYFEEEKKDEAPVAPEVQVQPAMTSPVQPAVASPVEPVVASPDNASSWRRSERIANQPPQYYGNPPSDDEEEEEENEAEHIQVQNDAISPVVNPSPEVVAIEGGVQNLAL